MSTAGHCCLSSPTSNEIPPLNRRLVITGSIFPAVFVVSFLSPFGALNESLLSYPGIVGWAVLIGLLPEWLDR
jgi:hypothetical protein